MIEGEAVFVVSALVGFAAFLYGCRVGRRDEEKQWRFMADLSDHWIVRNNTDYTVMKQSTFFEDYHNPLARLRMEKKARP